MNAKLLLLVGILIVISAGCVGQDKTADFCTVYKEMYSDNHNVTINLENNICIVDENTTETKYHVFLNCGGGFSNSVKVVFNTNNSADSIRKTKLGETCEVIE